MSEILFPNDTPVATGMNSSYLLLNRLMEYYQRETGCGCIHFRGSSVEALLFFNKNRLVEALFWDGKGKSTGGAATEFLKSEIQVQDFRVSVYGIRPDALPYWAGLIHATPFGLSQSVSFTRFLSMLEKQYEGRPHTGYFRVQGDKRRQLGWVLFQEKRIYGFRLPGERAVWMEPEEMPDFIERFRNASEIRIDAWALPVESKGSEGQLKPPASQETIAMLQDLMQKAEGVFGQSRTSKGPFPIQFRKICVEWADFYEFLDPFAAELEYREGTLIFKGQAGDGEVIEGLCRVLTELMKSENLGEDFAAHLEAWKNQHHRRISELQVRFS